MRARDDGRGGTLSGRTRAKAPRSGHNGPSRV